MLIQRKWKRDGSINRMSLIAAAANLKKFAADKELRKVSEERIQTRLYQGDIIETKRAVFSVAWTNGNGVGHD